MTDDSRQNRVREKEIETFNSHYSRLGAARRKLRRYFRSISWFIKVKLKPLPKRCFDLLLSLSAVVILSPILMLGFIFSRFSFYRIPRYGKGLLIYDELSFNVDNGWGGGLVKKLRLTNLPILINVISGDMSFVGPRPMSPEDVNLLDRGMRRRHDVRPGLVSLWWIRRRANINYGTEVAVDLEYIDNQGLFSDIGILLRAIPAILLGDAVGSSDKELRILGIPIDNLTMEQAVDTILKWLSEPGAKQVCFVNADCANIAYKDSDYLKVLTNADLCLADGVGLKLAGKILSQDIAQNVNGTDMFPILCERLSGTHVKLFLLGAKAEVVQGLVDWIRTHHPGVQIAGYHHGYFDPNDENKVIESIRDSGAHLLLVAFGAPRQDVWINRRLGETGTRVAIGVGGLFDFYSGRLPRAPLWMREIGFEWLYRMLQEPGRLWKRYLIGNCVFLFRVLKEKLFPGRRRNA
jgi:N-acetylglucosaminyldiphosphoundecaprenol N-acetyl-beta-D-mannosaminyltransferase